MRDFPLLVLVVAAVSLWLALWGGASVFRRRRMLKEHTRPDYSTVAGAILTLLGLLIGFTFSMAVSRYDLRKSYEEEEANAIGTEFVRAELLPVADAARVKSLLIAYIDLRIRDYQTRDGEALARVKAQTGKVQAQLWAAVREPAKAQPTAATALVASGMNDVINSQGYAQAAWWNRIPLPAWWLLSVIALAGCALIGYGARSLKASAYFIWVLPAAISISLFLIADIDSPRGGLIRVQPDNLIDAMKGMRQSP